jgi:hypothetical protein
LKASLAIVVFACLLIVLPRCNKSPTNATLQVDEPTIIVVCNPVSAAGDAVVAVSIFIKGNEEEIRVFGLDMTFDPKMFEFEEVRKGMLTGGWAAVDGNEVGPGILKVGGFLGGGTAIPTGGEGTLAEIRLKVTGTDYAGGQQSQVCVREYTDDLAGFKPAPACSTFTLQK